MAHYLHRDLHSRADVHVLHNLRLQETNQPDQNDAPGACQIDHLVIHRWGMFIVECKSVTSEVRVQSDGSGGDEWIRIWNGKERGMPSPIRQAQRQGKFLRTVLACHAQELLGKMGRGLQTIAKMTAGSDQRGFQYMPIQPVVAISDTGQIRRLNGWTEPQKPFRVFVAKADLVPEKINDEIQRHRRAASPLNIIPTGDYGIWSMTQGEVTTVAKFLTGRHIEPRTSRPRTKPDRDTSTTGPAPAGHDTTPPLSSVPGCKTLRRDRPHCPIGQIRLLLALRQLCDKHAHADGLLVVPNKRHPRQRRADP